MEKHAWIVITKYANGSFSLRWRGNKSGIVTFNLEYVQDVDKGSEIACAIEKYGLEEVRRDSQFVYYKRTK